MTSIDGVPTEVVAPAAPVLVEHPIGAIGLDHVVVATDSLERTSGAIADATGAPLKRVREVGEIRQGFHRVGGGGLIVEVVERAGLPEGPATLWGLVLNVEDLDSRWSGSARPRSAPPSPPCSRGAPSPPFARTPVSASPWP